MPLELIVPAAGETISEAIVAKWHKQVGEPVAADELVAELETDKVTVQVMAPSAGVLLSQLPVGTTVPIGASIGQIGDPIAGGAGDGKTAPAQAAPAQSAPAQAAPAQAAPAQAAPAQAAPAQAAAPQASAPPKTAQPAAKTEETSLRRSLSPGDRRMLLAQGVDPGKMEWRICPVDAPVQVSQAVQTPPKAPSAKAPLVEEVVPMSPLRKRIAERLVAAQHTAAILTTFNEVDMTQILALRARYQDDFVKKYGIKLGFMSFFVKATVSALQSFPGLNSEVRDGAIVYKKYYDIGVAVGSGKGLVVPVVRGVDKKNFAAIEKEIAELAGKAKDNRLTLEDLSGGTFTISNGGIYGSLMSTPLLNMPQSGILGMHNIVKRPVAVGDSVEIRPMMYLAVSYDHRVVDGREAVQFLVHIKDHVEHPDKLLFDV